MYVPHKLCRVTVSQNKDLRLDTTSTYTCEVGSTYRFVAYTSSSVPPTASASDKAATVRYVQKVAGGYLYEVESIYPGEPAITVSLNGENASFPIDIKMQQITSDTPLNLYLPKGKSYTYKFTVTGNKAVRFASSDTKVLAVQSVRAVGYSTYYVTVTSVGAPDSDAVLMSYRSCAGGDLSYGEGTVIIRNPPVVSLPCQSDTTGKFALAQNSSYTFKLSNVTSFTAGTPGVFQIDKVKQSGADSYYKITALGAPGKASGFYMSAAGQPTTEVCIVTVGQPNTSITSDTTSDFSIAPSAAYQFKITAPGATSLNFVAGTSGVLTTSLVKHVGDDFYFKIVATGKSASFSGIYVSRPNQHAQKICIVSIR